LLRFGEILESEEDNQFNVTLNFKVDGSLGYDVIDGGGQLGLAAKGCSRVDRVRRTANSCAAVGLEFWVNGAALVMMRSSPPPPPPPPPPSGLDFPSAETTSNHNPDSTLTVKDSAPQRLESSPPSSKCLVELLLINERQVLRRPWNRN
jgi:hypothetical protein